MNLVDVAGWHLHHLRLWLRLTWLRRRQFPVNLAVDWAATVAGRAVLQAPAILPRWSVTILVIHNHAEALTRVERERLPRHGMGTVFPLWKGSGMLRKDGKTRHHAEADPERHKEFHRRGLRVLVARWVD